MGLVLDFLLDWKAVTLGTPPLGNLGVVGQIHSHGVMQSPRLKGRNYSGDVLTVVAEALEGSPDIGAMSNVSVIPANLSLAKANHMAEPKVKGREADASPEKRRYFKWQSNRPCIKGGRRTSATPRGWRL